MIGIRFLFPPFADHVTLYERAKIWVRRHEYKYFVDWSESDLKNVDPELRPLQPITRQLYKIHMNRSEHCRNVKLQFCLHTDSAWAHDFCEKLQKSPAEGGFTGLCQAKIAAAELWRTYSTNYRSHQARQPNGVSIKKQQLQKQHFQQEEQLQKQQQQLQKQLQQQQQQLEERQLHRFQHYPHEQSKQQHKQPNEYNPPNKKFKLKADLASDVENAGRKTKNNNNHNNNNDQADEVAFYMKTPYNYASHCNIKIGSYNNNISKCNNNIDSNNNNINSNNNVECFTDGNLIQDDTKNGLLKKLDCYQHYMQQQQHQQQQIKQKHATNHIINNNNNIINNNISSPTKNGCKTVNKIWSPFEEAKIENPFNNHTEDNSNNIIDSNNDNTSDNNNIHNNNNISKHLKNFNGMCNGNGNDSSYHYADGDDNNEGAYNNKNNRNNNNNNNNNNNVVNNNNNNNNVVNNNNNNYNINNNSSNNNNIVLSGKDDEDDDEISEPPTDVSQSSYVAAMFQLYFKQFYIHQQHIYVDRLLLAMQSSQLSPISNL
ncbi:hypothetical protein HELRODRAFT_165178 [Helobdella robusta]|uniref:Uncharacterized protein n=1 Tax=Helobdella robusta TaxID=6412 RepID=T1EWE0_HELRO|nr:hypothetical protein HELRODRAFT_165178 [Helobdella robusta]ESN93023.1 hypothetical protein HELRODRAFT_165178 [Helobdella robusta]